MKFILYRSECVFDRFRVYDVAILKTAVHNNAANDITGFLHRNQTHYFQYIEGPANRVDRLVDNIRVDHRHEEYQTLNTGSIETRRFPSWSMGYSDGLARESAVNFIVAQDSADTILEFLLRVAQQQRETDTLGRSAI